MGNLTIKIKCGRCSGTGIDNNHKDINGTVIPESCTSCTGTGYSSSGLIDVTDIMNELDYIHGKVTAIFNKIK